jgi:uncharacterized protein involved in exopolysaccharide biosynthesis
LGRRLPLLVLSFVIGAGVAYFISNRQTKQYTATATLTFGTNTLSQAIAGLPTSQAGNSATLLASEASNVEQVRGGKTAAKTAALLGLSAGHVIESVSVSGLGESPVVAVSATTTSPVLSAHIANTYVQQFQIAQEAST